MSQQSVSGSIWVVVPASGVGARMQSHLPKQYIALNGKPCLQHTLDKLSGLSFVAGICVSLSDADDIFSSTIQVNDKVFTTIGGAERCHSVRNGLQALLSHGADAQDWVLVHDAARPCVEPSDIEKLVFHCQQENQSGILATPVTDTVKLQNTQQRIQKTVDRSQLWLAQTPQCSRLKRLAESIDTALAENVTVTDEASALEHVGEQVLLVEGKKTNIKITRPDDVWLAEKILERQSSE